MEYTTHYNLKKPEQNDFYDIENENDNMDTIDEKLHELDSGSSGLDEHLADKDNPHEVTKSQVGLGNVVNTGDSAVPTQGGTDKFTTGGAYTELAKKIDTVTGEYIVKRIQYVMVLPASPDPDTLYLVGY